jgi:hypothetical protein
LLVITGLLGIGIMSGVGAFLGNQWAGNESTTLTKPIDLHAGAAIKNDSLSMATGLITNEVEGLWLLDHETGNLQCWVMNPRTGAVAGVYATNVAKDMELSKGKPEFLMAAGNFFFTGGNVGNLSPANSICYVSNTTSGIVAGYSVAINRQALKRGIAENGRLTRVCIGKVKEAGATRDQ